MSPWRCLPWQLCITQATPKATTLNDVKGDVGKVATGSCASKIIGKTIANASNETVGKVEAAAAVYFSSSNRSSRLRWSGLKLSSEISHSSVSPRGPLVAAMPSRLSTATGEASRASSRARIVPPG